MFLWTLLHRLKILENSNTQTPRADDAGCENTQRSGSGWQSENMKTVILCTEVLLNKYTQEQSTPGALAEQDTDPIKHITRPIKHALGAT